MSEVVSVREKTRHKWRAELVARRCGDMDDAEFRGDVRCPFVVTDQENLGSRRDCEPARHCVALNDGVQTLEGFRRREKRHRNGPIGHRRPRSRAERTA